MSNSFFCKLLLGIFSTMTSILLNQGISVESMRQLEFVRCLKWSDVEECYKLPQTLCLKDQ